MSRWSRSSTWIPVLALGSLASAQDPEPGRFTNFETPQTHPIDIATVDGDDYVLVCNTPNNAIEIYEAAAPHDFVASIRVGLGPASVRWNDDLQRFFVANFDGDSVSVVRLSGGDASPGTPIIERTTWVGDEPSDVSFSPTLTYDGVEEAWLQNFYVTLSSSSRFALIEGKYLDAGGCEFEAIDAALLEADPLTTPPGDEPPMLAVKMPRQIVNVGTGGVAYVSNLRAGSPGIYGDYDVGIYRFEPEASDIPASASFLGGMGSTIHAFAMRADGQRMFVVGTKARNNDVEGIGPVSGLATGFVQSWLWVVDISTSGVMTLRPEQTPFPNAASYRSINLNRDYNHSTLVERATSQALVQPTDVLVIHTSTGLVARIVIAAYHSDRVAVMSFNNAVPGGYIINRAEIPTRSTGSYSVAGPRGLAYSEETGLVYINGRLDNSLHVLDPFTGALTSLALQYDPTPVVIREGREFLYSNRFSIDDSGMEDTGGFVSCASCHIDGRTDGLAWELSEETPGPSIEAEFHDGDPVVQQTEFAANKGLMVTQTLQGLINYPLNEEAQFASTNAPYYWRGARRGPEGAGPFDELITSFDSFNEAFVQLQGMDDIDGVNGIPAEDMVKFRRFVNTIMYPPNPEQLDDEGLPTRRIAATGSSSALLGMALFHEAPAIPQVQFGIVRSCVDCHHLPDGSNSSATERFSATVVFRNAMTNAPTLIEGDPQTFETAALRNIAAREMWLHSGFSAAPSHLVANTALLHAGTALFDDTIGGGLPGNIATHGAQSINRFNESFFTDEMPGPSSPEQVDQIRAVTAFMRQLDTGIAPAVGLAYTVDPDDSTANDDMFDLLEGQVADGNIGLGVYVRASAIAAYYWYDLRTESYRKQGSLTTFLSRSTLLDQAIAAGNVVIAQATPLGGERRWASDGGIATLIEGDETEDDPDMLLQEMVPNTGYVDVASLDGNLNLQVVNTTDSAQQETTIWALRNLQDFLDSANSDEGAFGVDSVQHEPPRRFRVIGDYIRPGARLFLEMTDSEMRDAVDNGSLEMEMDLYPALNGEGELVWETFVELDALHTFALLNGGFQNEEIRDILLRRDPSLDLDIGWNQFRIRIENEDGTSIANDDWQQLAIQNDRD